MLSRARISLVAAALVALAPAARAQTQSADDIRALEAKLKKLAVEATPKTVCVKSYIDDDSDKAGYGSGAIVSEDGYILTCAHVVDIAKRCEVMLADGSVHPAKMLGKNRKQDYALVKIDAHGLKTFEIGDSSKLAVGDWVVALGHPGGPYEDLKPSFAAGRVTGLHRKLAVSMMNRFYDDGIQTDVPIVFGNSGGPLVSLDGKLVGLNGAIIMVNDFAFAVPINEAKADLDAMKTGQMIAGKDPTNADIAEFQKILPPDAMQKMLARGLKNLGKAFGGKNGDNPLGKLFGGKDGENPFGDLFGKNGDNLQKLFGKLFGGDRDDEGTRDKGDEDQNADPQAPDIDFGKIMKQFQKMMEGGKDGENPFGKLFGNGENGPDMKKIVEGMQKLFGGDQGGDDEGDDDEGKAPRRAQPGEQPGKLATPPAVDRGGWLGVKAAQGADAAGRDGVVVADVVADSPAAKGGLQKGDVIVALEGRPTPEIGALQAAVRSVEPGKTVRVLVDRTRVLDATVVHERVEVKVTIAAREKAK